MIGWLKSTLLYLYVIVGLRTQPTAALRQSANRELEDSQWSSLKLTPEWHLSDRLTNLSMYHMQK